MMFSKEVEGLMATAKEFVAALNRLTVIVEDVAASMALIAESMDENRNEENP